MSLIYPHFLYGNFILDSTNVTLKDRLRVAQNNALRVILKVDFTYPSARLLLVTMKKSQCNIVDRGINDLGPTVYNSMFNLRTYERSLRANDLLLTEPVKCRTKFGERNMKYRGAQYT